ncbi:MAG: hypothetical protein NT026_00140 [Candidatus Staskawiczbacteria bacterium]|nr:hypothetical protein [Candidatus Staskawiczbacteria bacterium]
MKITIHGHIVEYDNDTAAGMRYLSRELDGVEAKVFFDQAYNHGSAVFEDHFGYKFKLVHHGGEYQLIKA